MKISAKEVVMKIMFADDHALVAVANRNYKKREESMTRDKTEVM